MQTDRRSTTPTILAMLILLLATASASWSQTIGAWATGHWDASFGTDALDGDVFALEVYLGELYAAGHFTDAAGTPVRSIARWDGSQWRDVDGGVTFEDDPGTIRDLAVYDDGNGPQLYAVGEFDRAGNVSVLHAARWDGSAWSDASAGFPADIDPRELGVVQGVQGPVLYSGGWSFGYGCTAAVFQWSTATSSWQFLLTFYPDVTGIDGIDDGSGETVFVGGPYFHCVGGPFYNGAMKWDNGWQPLESVFQPEKFITYNGLTYAVGITVFDVHDDEVFGPIESWNGTLWEKIPNYDYGTPANGYALEVYNDCAADHLFVGGSGLTPAGLPVNSIYKLRGAIWRPLGSGIPSGTVHALEVYEGELYVAGRFSTAGGHAVENIARWTDCR